MTQPLKPIGQVCKENHERHFGKTTEVQTECPDDLEIIGEIMAAYNVSYGTACDWILEVAENLRNSP